MMSNAGIVQRILALPQWLAVAIVVVLSVGGSVIATVILKYAQGAPIALFVPYMLVPATVPVLVSAPIATLILRLLHELDAVRRQAEQLASTDLLTGALNRRRFIELAQRELQRARFVRAPLSILLLDVDDFKDVNDRHGHDVGDQVLVQVAATCMRCLRPGDPFARWGGEEFVALLPGAGAAVAVRVALRVRDAIAATRVTESGKSTVPLVVTASIGVAALRDDGSIDLLISRADRAMYHAKRNGKNAAASDDGPVTVVYRDADELQREAPAQAAAMLTAGAVPQAVQRTVAGEPEMVGASRQLPA
ncbi:MAG: GGDEF domain-containing protein [Lautropia sp.]